jgi:hypothetical protein
MVDFKKHTKGGTGNVAKPPSTTEASTPPVVSLSELETKVKRAVVRAVEEVLDYQDQIRALEAMKEQAIATLTALGATHGLPKVVGQGWYVMPPVGRSTLKKELLLEQGVTVEQIENATVVVPGKNYSVRRAGRGTEG